MKKSVIIALVVLFSGSAFASTAACSKRATGTLFSDSSTKTTSEKPSSSTQGRR